MLDRLKSSDFSPFLHQTFYVHYGATEPLAIELIQVVELPAQAAGDEKARQPFSVIFREPNATGYLVQHIYRVEHEAMGSLDLFLVPIGPDKQGMRYEAVFT